MSKEFEARVLNKLENLELEIKNTNSELKNLAENTDQRLENLEIGQKNINQRLGILETEVKDTGEVVKYLNNNFTRFDFEINKKIDTLFDAITANNEKHDLFEKSIVSLNTKTFNHDIRISVLEDYSKNEKLFATN